MFETERLILRPWEETDAEDLFEYAQDPRVGPRAGWPPHTDREASRNTLRNVLMVPETYAVVLKENGRAVGSIGVHPRQESSAEPEIGYWIGVPYWGKGYIPEAVREILRHCFEDLGCTAVWCGYYAGNEQSRRVQEKCGFRPRTFAPKQVTPMGDYRDTYYNCLTREEWMEAK